MIFLDYDEENIWHTANNFREGVPMPILLALAFVSILAAWSEFRHMAPPQTPTAATKLFHSSDGGVDSKTMQRAYEAVAAALTTKDGFTLVKDPSQADVLASLSCQDKPRVRGGDTFYDHVVRLSILEKVTRTVLWTVEERGPFPPLQLSDGHIWGKNFSKVADTLASDVGVAEAQGRFQTHP